MENISITDIITAVGGLFTALLAIGAIIVKLTPTKKDDEVFEKVEGAVKPVLGAVVDKTPSAKE